jgi:hypothetical protein
MTTVVNLARVLEETRRQAADDEFTGCDFGRPVVAANGWETTLSADAEAGAKDVFVAGEDAFMTPSIRWDTVAPRPTNTWSRVVFFQHDLGADHPSVPGSFTVIFHTGSAEIEDAYGTVHGERVGNRNTPPEALHA